VDERTCPSPTPAVPPVSKNILSSCHWKLLCVLFLVERRVSMVAVQFVTNRLFFSYFLPPESYRLALFVASISTSIFIFLISNFCSWFFIEILFVFNFILPSLFAIYCFLSVWSSFYLFFWPLVELSFLFNFILQ